MIEKPRCWPGTFLVKTVKANSQGATYDQNIIYEAWRPIIQRNGIQGTPDLDANRYGRVLQQDETALAARNLNQA